MQPFGKYTLLEELGRGGFGVVYKAKDSLDRFVAIKLLAGTLRGDPSYLQRFQREARAAAALKHPNIVTIYEIGEEQGAHYLSMEYLEGYTLAQWLKERGAVPLDQATPIVEQIAAALDYAHQHGLVHRDVKPSNIIITPDGHVTLTDFGLVRMGEVTSLTMSGIIGTPDYISPEQAEPRDAWPQDGRMDVYALGVIVYQMLTGRLPFIADTPLAVLRAHVDQAPPRLLTLKPDLPAEIEAVILKALAKHPADRFATAGEFSRALNEVARQMSLQTAREQQLAAWYAEATDSIRAERWVEALSKCSQILTVDPAYRDVTTLLSQATAGMAQQQERLQRWAELQVIYQRAAALADDYRFDEAIHEMEALIARDADYPQAREKLMEIQKAKVTWLTERQARLDKLYQEAREALMLAMHKADELLKEEPAYLDADGVLAWLTLRREEEQTRAREAATRVEVEAQARREAEAQAAEKARLEAEEEAARARQHEEEATTATRIRRKAEEKPSTQAVDSSVGSATPLAGQTTQSLTKRSENEIALVLAPDVEMIFVRVPAGEFLMGGDSADRNAAEDEKPQHLVFLDEYFIGKYPVTMSQFAVFLQASQYVRKGLSTLRDNETCPVIYVSWHDAVAFCAWLSKDSSVNVRLPTEAEWEKAARGTDRRLYPWGNRRPDRSYCNFNRQEQKITLIGKYSPQGDSPYGCADVAGNVMEWVADWYSHTLYIRRAYYKGSPIRNPTGPTEGHERVLRGGAWHSAASEVRVSARAKEVPTYDCEYIGFRCALTLST